MAKGWSQGVFLRLASVHCHISWTKISRGHSDEMKLDILKQPSILHQMLLQVLHLLERIKRQNAGEEDLPPIAMPPLTKQQADGGPLKPRPSREELLTEDGFLDLGNGDELEEGFLPQIDADYGAEEGDEVLEDEILEDELLEDDLASSDARVDVIDAFLGGLLLALILQHI